MNTDQISRNRAWPEIIPMQFRFFALGNEEKLEQVGEIEADGPFAEIRFEVDRHFDNVVAPAEPRQVAVICTKMGEPPGQIVAVEAVYVAHRTGKVRPEQQVRTLVWLVEESVPRHR
jgi:hypothetical protein